MLVVVWNIPDPVTVVLMAMLRLAPTSTTSSTTSSIKWSAPEWSTGETTTATPRGRALMASTTSPRSRRRPRRRTEALLSQHIF